MLGWYVVAAFHMYRLLHSLGIQLLLLRLFCLEHTWYQLMIAAAWKYGSQEMEVSWHVYSSSEHNIKQYYQESKTEFLLYVFLLCIQSCMERYSSILVHSRLRPWCIQQLTLIKSYWPVSREHCSCGISEQGGWGCFNFENSPLKVICIYSHLIVTTVVYTLDQGLLMPLNFSDFSESSQVR